MTDTHPFSRASQANGSNIIISHQPLRHSGMNLTPLREEWTEQHVVERIRGGCLMCPGGGVWLCDFRSYCDEDRPAKSQPAAHSEQPPTSGHRRLLHGVGIGGVGANKGNEDIQMRQWPKQGAPAAASWSTVPENLQPVLQQPPPAATREPRTSGASKRKPSMQGGGPAPPMPSQSRPERRAPAKTLPPHRARPDLVQPPRQSGSRTQSMGPRTARPSLP